MTNLSAQQLLELAQMYEYHGMYAEQREAMVALARLVGWAK